MPAGVRFKPGDESHFAGRADFYQLRFGRYLIAMNTTAARTFPLPVPADAGRPKLLGGGTDDVPAGSVRQVAPRSTMVLVFGDR